MTVSGPHSLFSHSNHPQFTGLKIKNPNMVRIYLHNVNTLDHPTSLSFIMSMSQLFKYNIDIALLTEINAPFKLFNYALNYTDKLRSLWSQATTSFTPSLANNHLRSTGGIAQFNLTSPGRFFKVQSDKFSRWQTSFLYSRNHSQIAIITAYFPCSNSNPRPRTNNHLLYQSIQPVSNLNHPLQLSSQCWKDFNQYINQLQDVGIRCIIGMDANSDLQNPKSHVSKFIKNCDLLDSVYQDNPHQQNTATYVRGSKRIDVILTTKNLRRYTNQATIIPSDMIIQSDHLGIVLDISKEIFCCPQSTQTHSKIHRKLHSTHVPSLQKYIANMENSITNQKLMTKLQALAQSIHNPATSEEQNMYNALDNQITQCQRNAEKNCRKTKGKLPWSPKLLHTGWQLRSINSLIRVKSYKGTPLSHLVQQFISQYHPTWFLDPPPNSLQNTFINSSAVEIHKETCTATSPRISGTIG